MDPLPGHGRKAQLDFCIAPSHIAAMTALLLDTLRLSRALQDKGNFTSEQAEALAEALGEASQGDLATKTDLAGVRTEIAGLKTELKTELAPRRGCTSDSRNLLWIQVVQSPAHTA
jgi:hypothetical protein